MILREFDPEDDATLLSWIDGPDEHYQFTGVVFPWPLTADHLASVRADASIDSFSGVNENGVLVAHAELVSTGDATARLARVLVDPAARGRGLGRQLLVASIDRARSAGVRTLTLAVVPGNDRARSLYESLGFVSDTVDETGVLTMTLGL